MLVTGLCGLIFSVFAGLSLAAETTFDGVYTGDRVLTKGTASSCPKQEDLSVTIQRETLRFTHSRLQNFALGFHPHQDGSFSHIYQDVGGSSVLIQGRIIGDLLDADVSDNTCEHHWHLKKDRPL
jgi:hypothetical protein